MALLSNKPEHQRVLLAPYPKGIDGRVTKDEHLEALAWVALEGTGGINGECRCVVALLIVGAWGDLGNGSDIDAICLGDIGFDGTVNGVSLRRG
ncbi:MAG: hypothetical protein NT023_11230 [Armatimonadetes bacterium]|nr:hypothetical protein [Armatimonadota bacterium]